METDAQAAATKNPDEPSDAVESRGQPPSDEPPLDAQLADANTRAERFYNDYLYAQAEIENVKKRMLRQAEERLLAGKKATLGKFLPVLDNLQRALTFGDSAELRGGLQATLRGFEALLESERVTPVEVVGKPFDPRVAEAILTRETSDVDDGVVLEEVQRGYLLGDELLRPALVVVARRPVVAESP